MKDKHIFVSQMNRKFTDQMNRTVEIPFPPQRIVSLVPSQTELLYDLGLNNEIVGQTLFCIHPEEMHRTKPRVGGTKNVKLEKIRLLDPDLIIGNKEENNQDGIEELVKYYPVWMSDIKNLQDSLEMIRQVGALVNKQQEAFDLSEKIREHFDVLAAHTYSQVRTCAYLIWKKPWMAAGGDTFINDMLQRCGLQNVFTGKESRYPEVTTAEIERAAPEIILLSSEPYPFKEEHITALKEICPQSQIRLIDGELFSWYGSRLLKSVDYFKTIISSF